MRKTLTDYLDACIRNDVETVKQTGSAFWGVREQRPSQHQGFTGLMYAILYDYGELFAYLLPHEYSIPLSRNFMQSPHMLPAGSTIMHLIVFLQKCGI